jgi:hypothetical protein
VSEKLAVLEQLLENMIESCTGGGSVGVVFVNRRMTALALFDYFRTRKAKLEDESWKRITSTQYCRNIDNADVQFAPSVIPQLTQDRIDFSNNQYQSITSIGDVLESEAINNVLESVLPEDIHMRDIVDLDPSPIDIFNRKDCEVTGSGSKIINWYVKTLYSLFTYSTLLFNLIFVMSSDAIVRDATSVGVNFFTIDSLHEFSDIIDFYIGVQIFGSISSL